MGASFSEPDAPTLGGTQPSLRDDARAVTWWVLVGAAAGGIAGFVVGGLGGRLAMLLLRLTSPESVIGMVSDDGFVIGQVTTSTFDLAMGMAVLGGANGVLYAVVRTAIPARFRLPLWVGFAALVGGATFVHEDGVDFTVLEPAALAIALFVALPAIAAAVVVLLVERWSLAPPWGDRKLTALLIVGALVSTFALVFAAVVTVVSLALRYAFGAADPLRRVAGVLVPVGPRRHLRRRGRRPRTRVFPHPRLRPLAEGSRLFVFVEAERPLERALRQGTDRGGLRLAVLEQDHHRDRRDAVALRQALLVVDVDLHDLERALVGDPVEHRARPRGTGRTTRPRSRRSPCRRSR